MIPGLCNIKSVFLPCYVTVSLGPRIWPSFSSHLTLHYLSSSVSSLPINSLQKKNYERLQKALDSVMSIREMTQVLCPLPVSCPLLLTCPLVLEIHGSGVKI